MYPRSCQQHDIGYTEDQLSKRRVPLVFLSHSPVVVLEAGPPVWRLEQSLERAGEVHEPVAHQEEHG